MSSPNYNYQCSLNNVWGVSGEQGSFQFGIYIFILRDVIQLRNESRTIAEIHGITDHIRNVTGHNVTRAGDGRVYQARYYSGDEDLGYRMPVGQSFDDCYIRLTQISIPYYHEVSELGLPEQRADFIIDLPEPINVRTVPELFNILYAAGVENLTIQVDGIERDFDFFTLPSIECVEIGSSEPTVTVLSNRIISFEEAQELREQNQALYNENVSLRNAVRVLNEAWQQCQNNDSTL